jgi:hypothetical protein
MCTSCFLVVCVLSFVGICRDVPDTPDTLPSASRAHKVSACTRLHVTHTHMQAYTHRNTCCVCLDTCIHTHPSHDSCDEATTTAQEDCLFSYVHVSSFSQAGHDFRLVNCLCAKYIHTHTRIHGFMCCVLTRVHTHIHSFMCCVHRCMCCVHTQYMGTTYTHTWLYVLRTCTHT